MNTLVLDVAAMSDEEIRALITDLIAVLDSRRATRQQTQLLEHVEGGG